MLSTSARFQQALRTSGNPEFTVDVTWPGGVTEALAFTDGSVTVDATAKVRRKLDLQVPDAAAWREIVLGGATLRPRAGFRYVDQAVETVPLGVFEVRGATEDSAGMTPGKLTAPDRWRRVQRARFYVPTASSDGATVAGQWFTLVAGAFPVGTVDFANDSADARSCPYTVWDRDRDASAEDLARSLACEGFFDQAGSARLRPVPTLLERPVAAAWTVDCGQTGVLLDASSERSDERAYSAVVVTASRTDGTLPFEPVVVEDLEPTSGTWVLGPFGRVPRFYASPLLTTVAQAQAAGEAILRTVTGFASSVTLTALPNPALDAGDTIEVVLPDGRIQRHLLDALTIPLVPDRPMPLSTRSSTPVEDES